ncbi:MAG: FHIPEP family type III secretion protein [Anaeromyxobacter sp.]|nr:FHIPEP family type III secretion protein [Anaeromyxobacter sp.]MBL0275815.1 FHIPEP family type III secretion protein [Anaeromyxobacter sp.]
MSALDALHALLARLRGSGDVLFALAVLAVVVLLVAPVPPALLDAGLALSLALSATLLTVTLLSRDALAFATFPALLLLTTLLRLALSVSSTRLVLTRGEAGRVIEAFGRVVVQGSPVAGAVVFAVLTLVQLLVVAKGAERVAEVAARFTLDALPGKQLAIDADQRAGLLSAEEAARRRRALERECQLHGAMDGALKFVKGDAVAGVAIVLVNAAGGLAAGLLRGRTLADAAGRAVLLAVGDGLAAQVPSLLTAVAAGLAVTRVAAEEEGRRLGGELGRQLLAEPRALGAVAALMLALAAAPGLPALPFLSLAAGALALAWPGRPGWWRPAAAGAGAHPWLPPWARASPGPPGGLARVLPAAAPPLLGVGVLPSDAAEPGQAPEPALVLELSHDLLQLVRDGGDRFLAEALPALREQVWRELGVPVPPLAVRGGALAEGEWVLLIHEVPAAGGRAAPGELLALAPPDDLLLAGVPFVPALDQGSGRPAALVAAADGERAAALGPVRAPLERVAEACGAELSRQAALLMGLQESQVLLDGLEASAPALVREVARQVPPALLAEVLRRLLEEGVPIRPLRTVLEALLEAGGAPRGAAALAAAARRAQRRHIGHRAARGGALVALLLDPEAEGLVRSSLLGEHPALAPDQAAGLLDALAAAIEGAGEAPVLLASADVRRAVRLLVAPRYPRLQVLAYDELPPEQPVRPVGRLRLVA